MTTTSFMTYAFDKGHNCEKTTTEPVLGHIKGSIPTWLEGSLICNGPGIYSVGSDKYNHAFDGLAILHRYHIKDGRVTYRSRALESDTYKKNMKAERIVVSEFGTASFPDPCSTFFEKLGARLSIFKEVEENITDNCNVSVGYYGDQLYAMTESNLVGRIDPEDLKTVGGKTRISDYVAVNQATAHPHVMQDGSVLNMGNNYRHKKGPHYCIFKVPAKDTAPSDTCFKDTQLVAEIPCSSWRFPSYYHSFGVTHNYVIFIESPLRIDVLKVFKASLLGEPISSALTWKSNAKTKFHVVSLQDGKRHPVNYESDAFFTLHHINAYKENGVIVLDLSTYDTGSVVMSMFECNSAAGYDSAIKEGRAKRYFLPLAVPKPPETKPPTINCEPHYLTKEWVDFPGINYKYSGRKYKYFYALAMSAIENVGGHNLNSCGPSKPMHVVAKIDVETNLMKTWSEPGKIPSEPIYVANPTKFNQSNDLDSDLDLAEDDGVLLVTLLHIDKGQGSKVTLVILNASDLTEAARVAFDIAGTFTGTFHGQWAHAPTRQKK